MIEDFKLKSVYCVRDKERYFLSLTRKDIFLVFSKYLVIHEIPDIFYQAWAGCWPYNETDG